MKNFQISNKDLLEGVSIIDASAGTGKTYNMALIVLKLIIEKMPDINIDQILAVTFAKSATYELKSRIRGFVRIAYDYTASIISNKIIEIENEDIKKLIDAVFDKNKLFNKLNYALLYLDEAPIYTIHSFCQRLIKEFAFELKAPFDPDIIPDDKHIRAEFYNDVKRKLLFEKDNKVDQELPENLDEQEAKYLQKRKTEQNVLTYDDLIDIIYKAVNEPQTLELLRTRLPLKYKAVMVDEFQDTDKKQAAIFTKIFTNTATVMVFIGDPKQSIYKFRGADLDAYNDVKKSLDDNKKYTLGTNYRATAKMVEAVNTLFTTTERASELIGSTIIPLSSGYKKDEEKGELICLYQKYKPEHQDGQVKKYDIMKKGKLGESGVYGPVLSSVAEELRFLIQNKGVKPSDVAILIRNKNQATDMKNLLDRYEIPSVVWGAKNVFSEPELDDVLLVARAMSEPSNSVYIKSALFGELIGYDRLSDIEDNEALWLDWVERFKNYHEMWNNNGFFTAITHLMDTYCKQKVIKKANGLRKVTNVIHISELVMRDLGIRERTASSVFKYLLEKANSAGSSDDEYTKRIETDDDVVNITTIHKSKGLEFPIVFIPFAWTESKKEEIDEETRLLYVAVTRAKYRAYISWGKIKSSMKAPLGKILYGEELGKIEKNYNDEQIINLIKQYFTKIKPIESVLVQAKQVKIEKQKLFPEKLKTFNSLIKSAFDLYSYTSIVHSNHSALKEPDFERKKPQTTPLLPLGARTGIIIHNVMEEVDFTKIDPDKINFAGLDSNAVMSIVDVIMEKDLNGSGLRLKNISKQNRVSELEFCFNVENRGFVRGFIDLLFRYEGKYYILDWKTDFLGDSEQDYAPEDLEQVVKQNRYDLQYMLYLKAVDLHLKKTLKDYDYEKHFGGIYYIFLRGISADNNNNGIYFTRPSVIQEVSIV